MGTTAREQGPTTRRNETELAQEPVARQTFIKCRICTGTLALGPTAGEHGLRAACIFGEEGRKRNLQSNIQKYLHITVSVVASSRCFSAPKSRPSDSGRFRSHVLFEKPDTGAQSVRSKETRVRDTYTLHVPNTRVECG